MLSYLFFFNDTATTEIYTYYTLFPYTTLFRSPCRWRPKQRANRSHPRSAAPRGATASARTPTAPARRCRSGRAFCNVRADRSEEHTSELQSLMRISYAVFCLKKKITQNLTTPKRRRTTRTKSRQLLTRTH